MRTLILMDLANQTGGLVVGTGDLSELALGWCTYNGDHMSMYAVNSSVPKTLVRHLVRYEGKRAGGEEESVLSDILATEVSPELLPPDKDGKIAQKTEDIVGPYELHDFFLYRAIRCGDTPERVLYLAGYAFRGIYPRETLLFWLKNSTGVSSRSSSSARASRTGSRSVRSPCLRGRTGGCLRTRPRPCGWKSSPRTATKA